MTKLCYRINYKLSTQDNVFLISTILMCQTRHCNLGRSIITIVEGFSYRILCNKAKSCAQFYFNNLESNYTNKINISISQNTAAARLSSVPMNYHQKVWQYFLQQDQVDSKCCSVHKLKEQFHNNDRKMVRSISRQKPLTIRL